MNLPLDYPRQVKTTPLSHELQFVIQSEVAFQLKDLAVSKRITLNVLLFAIYGLLLSKLGNQKDLCIGSVVSGRFHPDLYNIIGVFTNTLPIRVKLNRNNSFPKFLKEVGQAIFNSYENQDVPLGEIAKLSRNHLLNTIFVFHNELTIPFQPEVSGLTFNHRQRIDTGVATTDLLFEVLEGEKTS